MTTVTSIWDQSHETLEREELRQLQLERLQASIFRAYRNVAFYRKRFDEYGIAPEDIQSLDDAAKLPFTTREDLRAGYPYDMLAVPLREVVRLHSSSWSTGRPVVCAFTRNDLVHWRESNARLLAAAGVTRDDVALILFGARKLDSGLGFHGGAERIGASVVPSTPEDIEQQIGIMQDFRTTVIAGTPSDGARLAAALNEHNLSAHGLSLRVGLFGGEPWSEAARAALADGLGIDALDYYDLSEVGGPGIAGECPHKVGLHLAEDQYLAEIVDPQTGEPLPAGQTGELVITTLAKEAAPLIRFRTRDVTSLSYEPCACGRTLARMARITSRTDDLVFAQGYSFHPSRIAALLGEVEGGDPRFLLAISRVAGSDEVDLHVDVAQAQSADSLGKLIALEQRITESIRKAIGITVKVHLVEAQTFARLAAERGARVVDTRG
jgi:phenylacetate-CoA ligase